MLLAKGLMREPTSNKTFEKGAVEIETLVTVDAKSV
jgi:hypothetical protein